MVAQPTVTITKEELALIGLHPGAPLPEGGVQVVTTYNKKGKSRTGTSSAYLHFLNPLFHARCDVEFCPGSFNLWTEGTAPLGEPLRLPEGEFWPVILEERAIGVVFRQGNDVPDYLEVFSPVNLKDRLGVKDEQSVNVRLLPGSVLC